MLYFTIVKNVGQPNGKNGNQTYPTVLSFQPSHGLLQDMQQEGLTQLFSEWARCLQRSTDSDDSYLRAIFCLSYLYLSI